MIKNWLNKILRYLSLIIFAFIGYGFSATTNIYDYAYIPDTDSLQFNYEIGLDSYKVYIDWNKLTIFTGNNGITHHCWEVVGTGITERLGKVFFGYTTISGDYIATYICNDGYWRGKAKLEAGGWIDFDVIGISGAVVNNFIYPGSEPYYHHSADGKGNGTGYAFTDGVGLWIWDLVKFDYNPRQEIIKYISNTGFFIDTFKSDLIQSGYLKLKFFDNNQNPINDLEFNIYFTGSNNYFYHNGKSTIIFDKNLNEILTGLNTISKTNTLDLKVYAAKPGKGNVSFVIGWGTGYKVFTITGNFLAPFDLNFSVSDGDGDGKVYIGGLENGKIGVSNISSSISNLSFNGFIGVVSGNYSYDFLSGKSLFGLGNFYIKIFPSTELVDDFVDVYYIGSGSYDISNGSISFSNITFSDINTNTIKFYADKNIVDYSFTLPNVIVGDGLSIYKIFVKFLNKFGYGVGNIKVNNFNLTDAYKSYNTIKPYQTFDLNETDSSYTTGLYLRSWTGFIDKKGDWYFEITSYKPVYSAAISGYLSLDSIGNFDILITGINFKKAIDIYFSGNVVDKGVVLNANNEVEVVYEKLVSNILSGTYYLSGGFVGCSDCVFETGGIITGEILNTESLNSKIVSIYVSGSTVPKYITYYNKYYDYYIYGFDGIKYIKLKPNFALNGTDLIVSDQVYGFLQYGLSLVKNLFFFKQGYVTIAGKGNDDIWSVYSLIKEYFNEYRNYNFSGASDWNLDNVSSLSNYKGYFECNGNEVLVLGNGIDDIVYDGYNEIFLKNCDLLIKSNILKSNKSDKFVIKQVTYPYNFIDFFATNGWRKVKNIYVPNNVETLMVDLQTNGALLFLAGDQISSGNLFIYDRWKNINLKRQIYILGSIKSLNTMGGGFVVSGNVMFPGGKKYIANSKGYFGDIDLRADSVARAYDINFFRANLVDEFSTTYDTGLVSDYILSKYACKGDKNQDNKICYMPVVVQQDNNLNY